MENYLSQRLLFRLLLRNLLRKSHTEEINWIIFSKIEEKLKNKKLAMKILTSSFFFCFIIEKSFLEFIRHQFYKNEKTFALFFLNVDPFSHKIWFQSITREKFCSKKQKILKSSLRFQPKNFFFWKFISFFFGLDLVLNCRKEKFLEIPAQTTAKICLKSFEKFCLHEKKRHYLNFYFLIEIIPITMLLWMLIFFLEKKTHPVFIINRESHAILLCLSKFKNQKKNKIFTKSEKHYSKFDMSRKLKSQKEDDPFTYRNAPGNSKIKQRMHKYNYEPISFLYLVEIRKKFNVVFFGFDHNQSLLKFLNRSFLLTFLQQKCLRFINFFSLSRKKKIFNFGSSRKKLKNTPDFFITKVKMRRNFFMKLGINKNKAGLYENIKEFNRNLFID